MRFLVFLFFLLFLAGLGVYGAGSSLPEQVTTIRGVQLPVKQTELWAQLNDFSRLPQWHAKIESITAIPDAGTQEALWHVKASEKQSYTIKPTYRLEPDILKFEMIENTLPYQAEWTVSLLDKTADSGQGQKEKAEGEGEASEIVVTQPESFVKIVEISQTKNPFFRFFMHYFIGYESAVEEYLEHLAKRFGVLDPEIRELVA